MYLILISVIHFSIIIFIFIRIKDIISWTNLFFGLNCQKFSLIVLLSFCLIFCQFQPGVTYKSVAYKKSVYYGSSTFYYEQSRFSWWQDEIFMMTSRDFHDHRLRFLWWQVEILLRPAEIFLMAGRDLFNDRSGFFQMRSFGFDVVAVVNFLYEDLKVH